MRFLYITRREMACNCGCGQDTFDVELSEVLETLRRHFRARVIVSSGNRCVEYNESIHKSNDPDYIPYSSRSQHLIGKAADIWVDGVSTKEVHAYLITTYHGKYGIGHYETFTHIDVRRRVGRW